MYHFEKTSDSLFKSFDCFLKIKQENSGWPSDCVTEDRKNEHIRQYDEREGVRLDPEGISKNPGLRLIGKLMMNSFWGRYHTSFFFIIINFIFHVFYVYIHESFFLVVSRM